MLWYAGMLVCWYSIIYYSISMVAWYAVYAV